jgi:2-keto-3-deoxy-L-rhamnonate aldolase RhmA
MLKEEMHQHVVGGLLVQVIDNPAIVLMARDAGIDFLFYDCEHGVLTYRDLHDLMLMGNECGMPSVVRVGELGRTDVSKILDFGATGVMVPMMETAEQARRLVAWSKYPPLGSRSYSGGAGTAYGTSGNHSHNMAEANARTIAIAQIETVWGVANVDQILSVDGIDAAVVGPCDLAISLGHPDDVTREEELSLIRQVADACESHGKSFGIIGGNALLDKFADSLDILVSAIDSHLIRDSLREAAAAYGAIVAHRSNRNQDSEQE